MVQKVPISNCQKNLPNHQKVNVAFPKQILFNYPVTQSSADKWWISGYETVLALGLQQMGWEVCEREWENQLLVRAENLLFTRRRVDLGAKDHLRGRKKREMDRERDSITLAAELQYITHCLTSVSQGLQLKKNRNV